MMNCDEIRRLNSPYLDSELDTKTTLEIQTHVDACPDCARLLAAEAKLDGQIMAGLKKGERTAELWGRIEQRVVAAARPHPYPLPSALGPRARNWLSTIQSQLTALLWPHPKAWAGLASVWLVLLIVNLATRERTPALAAQRVKAPSAETVRLLQQQEQLLAELFDSTKPQGSKQPTASPPRPRTEGQAEQRNA